MEVFPNVHWFDGGAGNCYLWVGGDELVLIDSGSPNQTDPLFNYIERIGRHPADLEHILITHADWDHAGSVGEIQARTGATVYAGRDTADLLQKGASPKHLPRLIQFFLDHFISYEPVPEDALQVVEDGDILPFLEELQVLATPGHTPDHHAFYSPPTGALFAGDALNTRSGELSLTPKRITADMDAARRSGRRLLALAPALIACGHGEPSREHSLRDVMTLLQQLK